MAQGQVFFSFRNPFTVMYWMHRKTVIPPSEVTRLGSLHAFKRVNLTVTPEELWMLCLCKTS